MGDLDEVQCLSDEMLAIYLQKEEQRLNAQNQKLHAYYDGQHSKVTMSSIGPTNLPRDALNFYYDDSAAMPTEETTVDELTYDRQWIKEENLVMKRGGIPKTMSKHNAKLASRKHMYRLNEYETGGNLDI